MNSLERQVFEVQLLANGMKPRAVAETLRRMEEADDRAELVAKCAACGVPEADSGTCINPRCGAALVPWVVD